MPDSLSRLLSFKDKRILFVGIGNVLRKDDGVGVYISSRITSSENISALSAEVSLENYIGKINSLVPDVVIIIDCVDMGSSPGSCKILPVSEINDLTFNTHNLSINRIAEFFKMPVYILGIQPEKIDFGENISYLVKQVADQIINQINK